jgi:hypothetical protein
MPTGRKTLVIGAVVAAAAAAAAVAIIGLTFGGGNSEATTTADYQAAIVSTRDRIDFSLGRLSRAQTLEELLTRMDEAAATVDDAGGDLNDVGAPDALEDQHERLVEQIESLAVDIQGTADQARIPGFEDLFDGAAGLDFPAWDAINAIFAELRRQGIEVEPLARKTATG